MAQSGRTGKGLKPRSHKELKELKLHGLEQKRSGKVISILGNLSIIGRGTRGTRQCLCGLRGRLLGESYRETEFYRLV